MRRKLLFASIATVLLGALPAAAQDYTLPPTYGQVTLNAGFTPDPYTVPLTSGGNIDAQLLGGNCRGMIANAPDFRLNYNAGSFALYISAISNSDTTLVINGPNGQWYCDDDAGGNLNPLVVFNAPMSGQYDIWVGSYGGGFHDATLRISELGGGGVTPPPPPPPTGGMPDYTLPPTYGQVALNAGFTPDPYTVGITAGGEINATVLGGNCRGMIARAPDFSLNYSATTWTLYISAISSTDTTIVVNAPNGQWYCDDDSAGNLNPVVTFTNPQSGRYDIWIGTYSGGFANSTLRISELGP
jgi:hypothetical protein